VSIDSLRHNQRFRNVRKEIFVAHPLKKDKDHLGEFDWLADPQSLR